MNRSACCLVLALAASACADAPTVDPDPAIAEMMPPTHNFYTGTLEAPRLGSSAIGVSVNWFEVGSEDGSCATTRWVTFGGGCRFSAPLDGTFITPPASMDASPWPCKSSEGWWSFAGGSAEVSLRREAVAVTFDLEEACLHEHLRELDANGQVIGGEARCLGPTEVTLDLSLWGEGAGGEGRCVVAAEGALPDGRCALPSLRYCLGYTPHLD